MDPDARIFPPLKRKSWNGDNYGPIVIPKKGMEMEVSDSTLAFYAETIRLYEHNKSVEIKGHVLIVDGLAVDTYTFKQNYYFMMGDNRHDSWDSRYWGFVPEDHIVGKALFIWCSVNQEGDILHKIRWNRLFNLVQ
jgi:signal peptidase I